MEKHGYIAIPPDLEDEATAAAPPKPKAGSHITFLLLLYVA
jgi:hypothetical protein